MGLPAPFNSVMIESICDVAIDSDIASYSWKDRGPAPLGYIQGMALAFGMAVQRFRSGDAAAIEMAKANTYDDEYDALSWYNSNFNSLGLHNDIAGIDTLRHLYMLMIGLGMRESSGKHCEGRDMSADNTSSDTAEAGMFQTSWNIHSCSSLIDKLFEEYLPSYSNDMPQCYLNEFEEEVDCSEDSWSNYGSGNGLKYQKMSKKCPPFHAEVTAIGLRRLRQHWGPINRKEVELRREADTMLREVQSLVEGTEAPPQEEVNMNIVISSGHGKYIRGASGYLDEVNEARRVVPRVAQYLTLSGAGVKTFNDDISDDQEENLNRIVDYHNAQTRDLDVSVHFNAYNTTNKPMGTECLYVTQQSLAAAVAGKIAACGFINRGAKKRTDLFFLNNTEESAILIEVCFVDSKADADLYNLKFDLLCKGIAEAILGRPITITPPEEIQPPEPIIPPVTPPAEVATVDIQITAEGPVRITVNGQDIESA